MDDELTRGDCGSASLGVLGLLSVSLVSSFAAVGFVVVTGVVAGCWCFGWLSMSGLFLLLEDADLDWLLEDLCVLLDFLFDLEWYER